MLSKLFPRSTQTQKPIGPTLSTNPTEPSPSPSADSETFRQAWAEVEEMIEEIEKAQELLPKLERMLYTKTGTLKKADIEFLISALKKL